MSEETKATCQLCGEPMPPGEEMFNYHGYSGPCPNPPLTKVAQDNTPKNYEPPTEEIERVAKAICDSAEADNYSELPEAGVVKALYRQQARDAILAYLKLN